jgi:hypothetical protein
MATVTATIVNGATESTPYTKDFTITVTAAAGPVKITPGAIAGVTKPVTGATPDMDIPATAQYTATIEWGDSNGTPQTGPFAAETAYIAIIRLTAKSGYTFAGLTEDNLKGFTVNSIVPGDTRIFSDTEIIIGVVFPATAAEGDVQIPSTPITGWDTQDTINGETEY